MQKKVEPFFGIAMIQQNVSISVKQDALFLCQENQKDLATKRGIWANLFLFDDPTYLLDTCEITITISRDELFPKINDVTLRKNDVIHFLNEINIKFMSYIKK